MSLFKKVSLILLCFILSACQEKYTRAYLLEHPDVLKNEVVKCQQQTMQSEPQTSYCERVMHAASQLMAVINEQQASPEGFGQKILAAEFACVQAKTALANAKQQLKTLRSQKAPNTDIQIAERKVTSLRDEHKDKHEQIKVLLAVAGLNSPE